VAWQSQKFKKPQQKPLRKQKKLAKSNQ